MADLIAPNSNDPQEMAKQVEAIAEAAAQHDEQVAQLLNLVPKAAALSTVASRAISFTKKNWVDTPTSGTPITVADMNRIEQAIVDLNTTLTSVQNSLSQKASLKLANQDQMISFKWYERDRVWCVGVYIADTLALLLPADFPS